jgi:uncharacterized protein (DUF58 family)
MLLTLKNRFSGWLFQFRGPETGSIVLVQRRIFILPSRYGMIYVGALLLMLAGSINYNLSLGFVLTFLLAALGINSILHTFRNLAHIKISPGRVQPVFAGELAHFTLVLENPGALDRYGIGIVRDNGNDSNTIFTDVPTRQSTTVTIAVPAPHRGKMLPGRMKLYTQYPLGLCHAWAYAEPDAHCLVYPRPEHSHAPPPPREAHAGFGTSLGTGQEDFAGLRSYHAGDSPRHIAWKAAARGQGLLTKQFSGRTDRELWLDWKATPDALGIEGRLSRLARWAVDANAASECFGLRLPGLTLPPAAGAAQLERCLEALALFKVDPVSP